MNPSRWVEQLWYGGSAASFLLLPFSWIYAVVIGVRRALYSSGIFSRTRLPVPVIVVGNITAGGTGKTPVVDWLVRYLEQYGQRPGVISRGYGGRRQSKPVRVTEDSDPAVVGDEPVLLARRGAAVCVCIDRVKAARHLIEAGIEVLIADDGLQYYRLARDLEIVVVDGQRGFGNERLLPSGPLRESLSRLDEADLLLVNGGDLSRSSHRFDLVPRNAVSLDGSRQKLLKDFARTRVWAVAGIGNPERFSRMLADMDIDVEQVSVPDHGRISLQSLQNQRPQPVLMTEKDAVKYRNDPCKDVWYVPVDVEMPESVSGLMKRHIKAMTQASEKDA